MSFDKDEANKEFGHQVPEKHAALKKEVQRLLCENLLTCLFKVEGKVLSVNDKVEDGRLPMKVGATKIAQSLAFMPDTIEEIRLHYRALNYHDLSFLTKILRAFPKKIKCADLGYSKLTYLTYEEDKNRWAEMFGSINPTVKTLNVRCNELHRTRENGFAKMISATPKDVDYLIFDENELHLLGEAGLVKGLSATPAHVKSISLRANGFDKFSGLQLANVLHALPPTVGYVDLSDNNLANIGNTGIALALSSFHSNLHTLVFQRNKLKAYHYYEKGLEEFADIFRRMSKSITKLYLLEVGSDQTILNNLDNITLSAIFKYFPEHTTIPNSDLLARAKLGIKEKEEKLKREKEERNRKVSELVKKFDVTIQELQSLIDQGIDINYQTDNIGYTFLMLALDAQNERIAEYLLSKGANPLIKNKSGATARSLVSRNALIAPILKGYELLFATLGNDITMVKSLVNSDNTLIDFQGVGGYTSLLIAVEQSLKDIVIFLLTKNPDLSITTDDGRGVLDLASDEAIKEMLIAAQNSNDPSPGDEVAIIDSGFDGTDQPDEGGDDTQAFKANQVSTDFFGGAAKNLKKQSPASMGVPVPAAAKMGSQP